MGLIAAFACHQRDAISMELIVDFSSLNKYFQMQIGKSIFQLSSPHFLMAFVELLSQKREFISENIIYPIE